MTEYTLGRLEQADARNKKFPLRIPRGHTRRLRSYTWKCPVVRDQGSEGACVGFGVAHELMARPAPVPPRLFTNPRCLKLYHQAQRIDQWPGGSYPGAVEYYQGTSVLAGAKVAKRMGYIKEYRWAFTFNDLLYGVGHNGPAVLGIPWHEDMYEPDEDNMVYPTGLLVGGHCILANGIDVKRKLVRLHNSWGAKWGDNGEAFITFDDLELLMEHGEACFFLNRRSVAR